MKFIYENIKELEKQYIHDSVFEGYHYDYSERKIEMSCIDGFCEKRIHLIFNNVIYSEMQSCEFWCPGANSIYDIWYEEDSHQMKDLLDILESDREKYDMNQLTEGIDFIQIKLQIVSGDILFVICESVDWIEEMLG